MSFSYQKARHEKTYYVPGARGCGEKILWPCFYMFIFFLRLYRFIHIKYTQFSIYPFEREIIPVWMKLKEKRGNGKNYRRGEKKFIDFLYDYRTLKISFLFIFSLFFLSFFLKNIVRLDAIFLYFSVSSWEKTKKIQFTMLFRFFKVPNQGGGGHEIHKSNKHL